MPPRRLQTNVVGTVLILILTPATMALIMIMILDPEI
jgi:hypothetical protein